MQKQFMISVSREMKVNIRGTSFITVENEIRLTLLCYDPQPSGNVACVLVGLNYNFR